MNYAIIGSGGFVAKRHIDAINDVGSRVILTCDINPLVGADFTDYRQMLADPIMNMVDAVSILTPNHLHPEHVRACLYLGKRVLVEKPLTINTDFSLMDGVYAVSQLRFHKLFKEINSAIKKAKKIVMEFKAYRDANFWATWKGDELKSGGCINVLGSHIFDVLLSALDDNYHFKDIKDTNKKSIGTIIFDSGQEIHFDIEFLDSREGQTRHLNIDGKIYQLSTKDNLSFEGLHDKVYKDFESGFKSNLNDAMRYVNLINKIKKSK